MTVLELEARVKTLEKAVAELQQQVQKPAKSGRWWRDCAGWFANDPEFDEMVRLGKEYRDSLRPGPKKKKKDKRDRT